MATIIQTTSSCYKPELKDTVDVDETDLVKIQAAYILLLQRQKKELEKKVLDSKNENVERFIFMNNELRRENEDLKKTIESLRAICGFD